MTQFEFCDNIHAWFVLIFEAQIVESITDWNQLEKNTVLAPSVCSFKERLRGHQHQVI